MRLLGLALVGLGAACGMPMAPCEPEVSLLGAWRYQGVQDAPTAATLDGTLEITAESCDGFQGRLDLVQVDGFGPDVRRAGPVGGTVVNGTTLRFDAYLEPIPRRHIATLASDSVDGSWILVASGADASLTGTFAAWRAP